MIKKCSLLGVFMLVLLLVPVFADSVTDTSQDIVAIESVAIVADDTLEVTFTSQLSDFNSDQVAFYFEGIANALSPAFVNTSLTSEGKTMATYTFVKDSQFKGFDSDTDGSKLSVKLNVASSLIIDKMGPKLVSAEYSGKEAYLTFDEALAPDYMNLALISLEGNYVLSMAVSGNELTVTCADDIFEDAMMTIGHGAVSDLKGNIVDEIEVTLSQRDIPIQVEIVNVIADGEIEIYLSDKVDVVNPNDLSFEYLGQTSPLSLSNINYSTTNEGKSKLACKFAKTQSFNGFSSDTDGSQLEVTYKGNVVESGLIYDKQAPKIVSATFSGNEAQIVFDEAYLPQAMNYMMIDLYGYTLTGVDTQTHAMTLTVDQSFVSGDIITFPQGILSDYKGNVAETLEVELSAE